jgi:hypothetical protein
MSKETKLRLVAEETIEHVLAEFLDEQRTRLKDKTFSNYAGIIELFQDSLDGYAYEGLSKADAALFDRLYSAEGAEHRDFCQIFGPEKIPENVGEFLNYFMVRKVMCGKDMLRAAGTVMKKLGKWLADKGYLDPEDAEDLIDRGSSAAKELPATEDVASMLYEYCEGIALKYDDDDVVEDHFTIKTIEAGKLHLLGMSANQPIVVPVPRKVSNACQEEWTISGAVVKIRQGWRLLEAWNVYP